MQNRFVSRGFTGKRRESQDSTHRLPPGQYLTDDFPVLSAGPTPQISLDEWSFSMDGLVASPMSWGWIEFQRLPAREFRVDISCVTKWTHLDMRWKGVSLDTLLETIELDPRAAFATAYSYGGYTTNLPLPDLVNEQAFLAFEYDGRALAPEHGGPVRLVVPHLYFWKSAKWVRGMKFTERDHPGFWESLGYHNRGDPWKEQRYQGD